MQAIQAPFPYLFAVKCFIGSIPDEGPCVMQRLLTHRVGHYYGLLTSIVEKGGHALQLSKGPDACLPEVYIRLTLYAYGLYMST